MPEEDLAWIDFYHTRVPGLMRTESGSVANTSPRQIKLGVFSQHFLSFDPLFRNSFGVFRTTSPVLMRTGGAGIERRRSVK
jgi:hypothetical protein